jgi:UV DNA damage repair endonuclease
MSNLYSQKIGFIGIPKRISGGAQMSVKTSIDFLELIKSSIELNLKMGIKILCIDTNEFKDLDFIYNFEFDEESPKVSKILDQINGHLFGGNFRICFIVPKEKFLGSQLDEVPEETSNLLEKISSLLDLFGQKGRSVIVRIGSAYGNRKATMESFNSRLLDLSPSCQKKICVMNDEKPSLFSVTDLISGCYYASGVPVCFRFLNHIFNDGGLSIREAFFLSCSTWKFGSNPIIIHAEPESEDEFGLPSSSIPGPFIKRRIPTFGLYPDILIDSPEKEIACSKYMSEMLSLPPIVFNKKKNDK